MEEYVVQRIQVFPVKCRIDKRGCVHLQPEKCKWSQDSVVTLEETWQNWNTPYPRTNPNYNHRYKFIQTKIIQGQRISRFGFSQKGYIESYTIECIGRNTYMVMIDRRDYRRLVDQLRARFRLFQERDQNRLQETEGWGRRALTR